MGVPPVGVPPGCVVKVGVPPVDVAAVDVDLQEDQQRLHVVGVAYGCGSDYHHTWVSLIVGNF